MMNKTIFLFTFRRFLDWYQLVFCALGLLSGGALVGAMWGSGLGLAGEFGRWLLFGPMVPLLIAASITMPQIANAQQRKDGEYLSLLFTRPISRASYVITKWIASSVFTFCIIMILAGIATGTAWLASLLGAPLPARPLIDHYGVFDALFNSISFSAVVTMVSAMPYRLRMYCGMFIGFFTLVGMTSLGLGALFSGGSLADASKALNVGVRFLGSFMAVSIDSYHVLNSADSPLTTFLIYVSNIILYLTIASAIMCQREFFYAND